MTQVTKPNPVSPVDCYQQSQIDKLKTNPNAKKIFVFCDGTGNKFVADRTKGGNSNVVKLYTTVRITNKQVAYYQPGVGTLGDPRTRFRLACYWSIVKGLAFGAGFKDDVLDAYRYLMNTYDDGDEIYVFGFSRGAYTARALIGMLHGYGLLCRGNEKHLLYTWQMFHDALKQSRALLKKAGHGRAAQTIPRNYAFEQTYSRRVSVRFAGMWDTVSSIGWIYKPLRLLDMARNPIILVGRHAISIDERRALYRDNLWGPAYTCAETDWLQEGHPAGIDQDIAQVWFPGVHSDIGGSYPQEEAEPANVTLKWMINELKNNGAELCQDRVDIVLSTGPVMGVYDAEKIYRPAPKGKFHSSLKGAWWILQGFPQQHYDKDDGEIQWRVPYGIARRIPDDAYIHGSAIDRILSTANTNAPYKPTNLPPAPQLSGASRISAPVLGTTANLYGCYVHSQPQQKSSATAFVWRWAKVIAGGVCFLILALLLTVVAGSIILCGFAILLWLVGSVANILGLRCFFHRALAWLLC